MRKIEEFWYCAASQEDLPLYKRIADYNETSGKEPVYLLGSVDGVGFSEHPSGTIVKMLDAFDDFFQMHTLFKIPLFFAEGWTDPSCARRRLRYEIFRRRRHQTF